MTYNQNNYKKLQTYPIVDDVKSLRSSSVILEGEYSESIAHPSFCHISFRQSRMCGPINISQDGGYSKKSKRYQFKTYF